MRVAVLSDIHSNYPDVCEMVKWLKDEVRKGKCVELIQALVDKPM